MLRPRRLYDATFLVRPTGEEDLRRLGALLAGDADNSLDPDTHRSLAGTATVRARSEAGALHKLTGLLERTVLRELTQPAAVQVTLGPRPAEAPDA